MAIEVPRQTDVNIHIDDGIGFSSVSPFVATLKDSGVPRNVTGYTAKFELRDTRGNTGDALLSLTESSGIAVGDALGTFTVTISPEQAVFGDKKMHYALVVYAAGTAPICLARGICTSHSMPVD